MPQSLVADPGSFRDRSNRVFDDGKNIVRGVDGAALGKWRDLQAESFFQELAEQRAVVKTEEIPAPAELSGWAGALSHERIPFLSYPYEWSFGMLQDAALLHLDILLKALDAGWTLKDASAYNIQFINSRPVFIDIPSFEPHVEGEPWKGYRQFCMMFLYPLMLKAYRGVDFAPFLRSDLEGIDPTVADRLLGGRVRLRKGVLSHVMLHSRMQQHAAASELDEARHLTEEAGGNVGQKTWSRQSKTMVLATIDGLRRTVAKLRSPDGRTTWGNYDTDHSYGDVSFERKREFVAKHAGDRTRRIIWDIGCNTGTFSRLCESHCDHVISIDGDPKAIERLYQAEKRRDGSKLLPMIMDLSNVSPAQGWRGRERKALEERGEPDLVLCLALIHHMVISANIPMTEFIEWLHGLGGDVIIEFVTAEDDMARMLLRNKVNQYEDYTIANFERLVSERFDVTDSEGLKGGHRKIYYLRRR